MGNEINWELRAETAGRGPAIEPFVPRLAMAVCAALMVISMILPLFTVTKEYAGYFDGYPEDHIDESTGLNIHELESVSPIDYGRIYGRLYDGARSGLYIGISAALVAAAVLTLLFAALNKPIGTIIFDILTFAVFRVMVFDLTDRGVVPSPRWGWSISYYLLNILPILTAALAIWMLAVKRKQKKPAKAN